MNKAQDMFEKIELNDVLVDQIEFLNGQLKELMDQKITDAETINQLKRQVTDLITHNAELVTKNQELMIKIKDLELRIEQLIDSNKTLTKKTEEVLKVNESQQKEIDEMKNVSLISESLTYPREEILKKFRYKIWKDLTDQLQPLKWSPWVIEELLNEPMSAMRSQWEKDKKAYNEAKDLNENIIAFVSKEWGFTKLEWEILATLKKQRTTPITCRSLTEIEANTILQ